MRNEGEGHGWTECEQELKRTLKLRSRQEIVLKYQQATLPSLVNVLLYLQEE